MQYGPEWQILVRGEKEANSYRSDADNVIDLNAAGTYASPAGAGRPQPGQGRIVCYPVARCSRGSTTATRSGPTSWNASGDRAAGRPSHSMKMQMNAYRWLAEPAGGMADFGTYVEEPYRPVQFPAKVDWDKDRWTSARSAGIRGIFGAHTAYSDGSGTVADYVQAAKAAGLSLIVFADPLEKLTETNSAA